MIFFRRRTRSSRIVQRRRKWRRKNWGGGDDFVVCYRGGSVCFRRGRFSRSCAESCALVRPLKAGRVSRSRGDNQILNTCRGETAYGWEVIFKIERGGTQDAFTTKTWFDEWWRKLWESKKSLIKWIILRKMFTVGIRVSRDRFSRPTRWLCDRRTALH